MAQRGVVVLGLAEQQRAAAFDVAQVDVVAERRAEDAAGTIYREHDLRLGIVPGRIGAHADPVAPADRRQRRRLGEDLRVRADRHFEILRPQSVGDQRRLELLRVFGARLHRADVGADAVAQARAQAVRLAGVAAAAFLDHALHGGDRESHAARLDALQVEGREQPHVLARRRIRRVKPKLSSGPEIRRPRASSPFQPFSSCDTVGGVARHVAHAASDDDDGRGPFARQQAADEHARRASRKEDVRS